MLSDSIICQLCGESLTAPLVLPCNHLFCGQCIRKHLEEIKKCPECEYTMPPDSELELVLRPHPISSIIDRIKQLDSILHEAPDDCSVESEGCQKYAEWYCGQCKFFLCRTCKENHDIFLQNHDVRSCTEHNFNLLGVHCYPEALCPHHQNNALDIFCFSCQVLVCQLCMQSIHAGHDSSDAITMFQNCKDFEQVLQENNTDSSLTREYDRLNTFNKAIKNVREEIMSYVDDAVRSVQGSRDRYIQELDTAAHNAVKHLESNINTMKKRHTTESLAALFYSELVGNCEDIHLFMARNILDSLRETLSSELERQIIITFPSFVQKGNIQTDIGKLVLPSASFTDEHNDNEHYDSITPSAWMHDKDLQSKQSSTVGSSKRHKLPSNYSCKSSVVSSALSKGSVVPTKIPTTVVTMHVSGNATAYINQDKENTRVNIKQSKSLRNIMESDKKLEQVYQQQNGLLEPVSRAWSSSVELSQLYQPSEKAPPLPSRKYILDNPENVQYSKTLPRSREKPVANNQTTDDRMLKPLPDIPPVASQVDVIDDHRWSGCDENKMASIVTQSDLLHYYQLPERRKTGDTTSSSLTPSGSLFGLNRQDNNPISIEKKEFNIVEELDEYFKDIDTNLKVVYEQLSIDTCDDISNHSHKEESEVHEEITVHDDNQKNIKNGSSKVRKKKEWSFLRKNRKKTKTNLKL